MQKGESQPPENEAKFVINGKANISINLTAKTPKVIEKLKQLGFEILTENGTNLIGRIPIEKIAQLAKIEQVQLILPDLE
ncbi:MAG TPA: hypothetical protein PKY82_23115 [Pyrinomonadaceae bacterium]|nr:hypothetical protein [Pyrinomonadaceae bacterium]